MAHPESHFRPEPFGSILQQLNPRQLVLRTALTAALAIGVLSAHQTEMHALQAAAPLRVQRAEIMDRNGFERPMVAYTLFVPAGWKSEGGIEYARQMNNCGVPSRINWKATAPDNSGAIQIIPEEKWSAANFPVPEDGCPRAQVQAARPYLEWWVQRNRPGARVLDYRERADLAAPFKSIARNSQGMRSWGDGGEILIAYQVGGRPVREAISSASFFIVTEFPSLTGGPSQQLLQGMTAPGFAMRMPEGVLNFKMIEALRQSIHSAPEWQSRMNQAAQERNRITMESNRQMAETNRREAAKRSEIIAQTGREIADIQMGAWQNKSESMDRQQRETIEGIRGVETYNDPHYGGTVQLSNQYQHAWQLRDGSYVLTDDVNFDPSRDLGITGARLKKTE